MPIQLKFGNYENKSPAITVYDPKKPVESDVVESNYKDENDYIDTNLFISAGVGAIVGI